MKTLIPLRALGVALMGVAAGACGLLTSPPAAPGSPAGFTADAASMTSVDLSWSTATGEVASYRLQRSSDNGTSFETVARPGSSATSYTDTGLTANTTYVYRLQACNDGGCSEPAAETTVTTFATLTITTASFPTAAQAREYSAGVNADGGDGDYAWDVTSGSLPPGLALSLEDLNNDDAVITGTPETLGSYTFTLQVQSGDGQTASRAFTLVVAEPQGLRIETVVLPPALVGAVYGKTLEATGGDNQNYAWSLVGGSLPPGIDLTAAGRVEGTASATDTAVFTLQVVSAGDTARREFRVPALANETGHYNITGFDVVDVPASIQPAVDSAIAEWNRALTGDLPAVSIPEGYFAPTDCGGFGEAANGTSTDDILVLVDIAPIDGPGKILGQAGPCGIRGTSFLPFVGILTLDSEDLAPLVGSNTLEYIISHEIGHILGFGSLWQRFDLVTGAGTADPRYTGSGAVTQWHALGGTGDVPLETEGDVGTKEVHWRESVFGPERMTGYSEPLGVRQPLSAMSIASFADLGYTVDLGAADPYSLPSALLAGGETATAVEKLGHDVVLMGQVRVLAPDGTSYQIRLSEGGAR